MKILKSTLPIFLPRKCAWFDAVKCYKKINQKYDKTLKVNTRNTHQYQLVHISNE